MSAYLQTSAAAQRALGTALKAGYNRLEDLQQIQCPSLVLAGRLTDTLQLNRAWKLLNASRIASGAATPIPPICSCGNSDQVLSNIDDWIALHPQVVRRGRGQVELSPHKVLSVRLQLWRQTKTCLW